MRRELRSQKTPKASQLELYANYILYGKNENNLSPVDEGLIEIDSRYKTFKRRPVDSIEEILENPLNSETSFKPLKRSIYTNPKPKLDESLPELQSLRESISYYENLIRKIESTEPPSPQRKTRLWRLNHTLIELRRE